MRSTKILAFSVPLDMEKAILKHAKSEQRNLSEYIREAIRHYMALKSFDRAQKKVATRLKKRGLKPRDVEAILEDIRSA